MQQAIEGGRGHDGVAGEDLAPIGEGLVAGQDDRLSPLVALADDLKEQAGLVRLEGQVADLVDDQELGPDEVVDLAESRLLATALAIVRARSMAVVK